VPVATRVVGIPFESARVALFNVATEVCGAADLDGMHDFQMRKRQGVINSVWLAAVKKDVSYFPVGSSLWNLLFGRIFESR